MASTKMFTLKSSDGETFEVEEAVAVESQTIKRMIEDDCANNVIPLNVTSKILAKVIEYCKKHVDGCNSEDRTAEEDLKAWDAEFVMVDKDNLLDLVLWHYKILAEVTISAVGLTVICMLGLILGNLAADCLKIKSLLDLTCLTVADMIKGKSPEEILKTFDCKGRFANL